jgi:hypothetical protein
VPKVARTDYDRYVHQSLFEPVMTSCDRFDGVFIGHGPVIWLFPFMVNRSRSRFSQK